MELRVPTLYLESFAALLFRGDMAAPGAVPPLTPAASRHPLHALELQGSMGLQGAMLQVPNTKHLDPFMQKLSVPATNLDYTAVRVGRILR